MAEGGKVDPKMAEELLKATQAVKAAAAETTNSFQEQLRIITQMRDVMSQLADSTKSMGGESQQGMLSPDKWQEVTKRIEKAKNEAKSSSDVMTKLGKVMKSDLTKSAVIATGAITGMAQGFRNTFAIIKAGFGILKSVTGAAFSLGKSLLSLPGKMSNVLQSMAAKGGGSNEVAQALEEIRDQYGSLKSGASQAIIQTSNNMMKMNETGVDSYRIFGNTAERLKLVTELANGMGASFGVFQDEIAANGTAIISYQKGLGLTNEQMGSLASNAMRMGKGVAQVQNEMTKQAVGMSKAFGVNAKVLSKDMGKAMADLAHFGHLSTKEMAIAATFANKLGVSVDKLTSVMDATSTFDQAAEGMSKLNEQFGTNIDATAIMSAQNPAEKVEILRKEFAKTGKSVESMSYQERQLIKQSSGLSDEMMNAAFSAKNAGVSLDAIQRQGSKNEKKTLSQADAMHELADSIKRLTPSGDAGSGTIFDRFLDGFGRGIMGSKEFIKLMNNIREIFRIASREGVKLGKTFVDLFPGVKDILQGLQGVFDPKRFQTMFGGINKVFRDFASSGSKDVGKLMNDLKDNFLNFFDSGTGPGKKVLAGFGKFFNTIGVILGGLAKWTFTKLADIVESIVKFIENPKKIPTAGTSGLSEELLKSLTGAFDALVDKLFPALIKLGKLLFEKFMVALKKAADDLPWEAKLGLAFAQFGPALSNSLGGALTNWVAGKAGPLLKEKLGGKFAELLGNQVGKQAAQTAAQAGTQAASAAAQAGAQAASAATGQAATAAATAAGEGAAATAATVGTASALAVTGAVAGGLAIGVAGGLALDSLFTSIADSNRKQALEGHEEFLGSLDKLSQEPTKQIKLIAAEQEKAKKDYEKQSNSWVNSWFGDPAAIKAESENRLFLLERESARAKAAEENLKQEAIQGTAQWIAKHERMRTANVAAAQEKALKDLGPVTIDNAAARFKKIDDLAKQIMGKDFDVQGKLDKIRKKLDGVNWSIVTPEKEVEINKTLITLESVKKVVTNIADIGGLISVAALKLETAGKTFSPTSPAYLALSSDGNIANAITQAGQTFSKIKMDEVKTAGFNIDESVNTIKKLSDFSDSMVKFSNDAAKLSDKNISAGINKSMNALNLIIIATETLSANLTASNVKENMASVQSVFETAFGQSKIKDITDSIDAISNLVKRLNNLGDTLTRMPVVDLTPKMTGLASTTAAFGDLLKDRFSAIAITGITGNINAVSEMVTKIQELDIALSKLPAIDMKAKLTALSKGLGLGSSGVYTVQSKDVVININMTVTMNAGEVERVIIGRSESVIRDRINFAIDKGGKADPKAKEALVKPNVEGNAGFYGRGIANSGG